MIANGLWAAVMKHRAHHVDHAHRPGRRLDGRQAPARRAHRDVGRAQHAWLGLRASGGSRACWSVWLPPVRTLTPASSRSCAWRGEVPTPAAAFSAFTTTTSGRCASRSSGRRVEEGANAAPPRTRRRSSAPARRPRYPRAADQRIRPASVRISSRWTWLPASDVNRVSSCSTTSVKSWTLPSGVTPARTGVPTLGRSPLSRSAEMRHAQHQAAGGDRRARS